MRLKKTHARVFFDSCFAVLFVANRYILQQKVSARTNRNMLAKEGEDPVPISNFDTTLCHLPRLWPRFYFLSPPPPSLLWLCVEDLHDY